MRRGVLEDLRYTGIEIIADYAEAYATYRKCGPHDGAHVARKRHRQREPGAGDFLYDSLRLSLGYLNELARLGTSYAVLPARILERVCADTFDEPRGRAMPHGERLTVYPDDQLRFPIRLRNTLDERQTARLCFSKFKDTCGDVTADVDFRVEVHRNEVEPDKEFVLQPCSRTTVMVTVIVKQGQAGQCLRGRIDVLFSESAPRSFPLVIDVVDDE